MNMLQKYLDLIPSLSQAHIDALSKFMLFGQPLPVGRLVDSWNVRDLLWNNNLVSLTELETKQIEAEENAEKLKKKTSKFDLFQNDNSEIEDKTSQSKFDVVAMGIKVKFSWTEAADALFAIIMIRKYHIAQKANEAKIAKAEADIKAKIEKFSDMAADKDPFAALKEAQKQLAILKGTWKEPEVVIKATDMI